MKRTFVLDKPIHRGAVCVRCGKSVYGAIASGPNKTVTWDRSKERKPGEPVQYVHVACLTPEEKEKDQSPREIESLYDGVCKCGCETRFHKGDRIVWNPAKHAAYIVGHNVQDAQDADGDEPEENESETPETAEVIPDVNDAFKPLADALLPHLQGKIKASLPKLPKVDEEQVQKWVAEYLDSRIPRTVEIKLPDGKRAEIKFAHKMLDKILYLICKRNNNGQSIPVYLYGGPGGGKSHIVRQIADSLDMPFYSISLTPMTPDTALKGFVDANGFYRATTFFKWFRDGGVLDLAETDNSSPMLQAMLNTALENGHFDFPQGKDPEHPETLIGGSTVRHADAVLMGNGNTTGNGGRGMFGERRPMDGAFKKRFVFVRFDYDETLERSFALTIHPHCEKWIDWVQAVRKYAESNKLELVASPRETYRGAEFLRDDVLSIEEIAEGTVFQGIDETTKTRVLAACPLPKVAPLPKAAKAEAN